VTPALLAAMLLLAATDTGAVSGTIRARSVPVNGAVVFLTREEDHPPVAAETTLIDQRNLRFVPASVVVSPGSAVVFRNSDPLLHNVFSPVRNGMGFNLGTYPSPGERSQVFPIEGHFVVLCHVHPEMVAYVVVAESHHRTVVSSDGAFRLDEIPAGRYRLHVWHWRTGEYTEVIEVPAHGVLRLDVELSALRPRANKKGW
jgi:plastocyanin